MTARSSRQEVRNPIAADPEVAAIIATLPQDARAALRLILLVLSRTWALKAEHSWRSRKGPMALYAKTNAVNARHLARALNATLPRST